MRENRTAPTIFWITSNKSPRKLGLKKTPSMTKGDLLENLRNKNKSKVLN